VDPGEIFPEEITDIHMKTFKDSNLFDLIQSLEPLKMKPAIQVKIFQLATAGVYSDLQFFLANGTDLCEEDLQKVIVLFYKVKKDMDPEFRLKANKFCAMVEAEGPTN
jgi:hypothetical protein